MPAGATYEPIATTTVSGADASTVVFSSLGSYTDIVAIITCTTLAGNSIYCRFNSDTASNYSNTFLYGNGTSATSARVSSQTRIYLGAYAVGSSTTIPTMIKAHFFSYGGSTNKTVLSEYAGDLNGSGEVDRIVGLWRSTSAITSITFDTAGDKFKIGSTFTLYGIKAA